MPRRRVFSEARRLFFPRRAGNPRSQICAQAAPQGEEMVSPYHQASKLVEHAEGGHEQKESVKKRKGEAKDLEEGSFSEVPNSPLRQDYDDEEFDSHQPFRGLEGYNRRQRYLRTYTFSRKQSAPQKVTESWKKLRNTAWAVMACNYKPAVASKIKEKLRQHTLFFSAGSKGFQMPRLHLTDCFRLPQIS